jgi:hypothetical protein
MFLLLHEEKAGMREDNEFNLFYCPPSPKSSPPREDFAKTAADEVRAILGAFNLRARRFLLFSGFSFLSRQNCATPSRDYSRRICENLIPRLLVLFCKFT